MILDATQFPHKNVDDFALEYCSTILSVINHTHCHDLDPQFVFNIVYQAWIFVIFLRSFDSFSFYSVINQNFHYLSFVTWPPFFLYASPLATRMYYITIAEMSKKDKTKNETKTSLSIYIRKWSVTSIIAQIHQAFVAR